VVHADARCGYLGSKGLVAFRLDLLGESEAARTSLEGLYFCREGGGAHDEKALFHGRRAFSRRASNAEP